MKRAPFFEIHIPQVMDDLLSGKPIDDFSSIDEFCDLIDTREDCNDFRMISLQRLLLQFGSSLPDKTKERIKKTILDFRYWMEEPGSDNMCFWSENHQLLFAAAEYVGASMFPNDVFSNTKQSGKAKIEYAKARINHWLDLRFRTGFIEWHSHVYYSEDLAALMHLVDFSEDESIRKKSTIITDLLFLDIALHSFKGNFALTHGRSYEMQKKSPRMADIAPIVSDAFGITRVKYHPFHIASIFKYRLNYKVPQILKDIAMDTTTMVVKDQMGFNLGTIRSELNLKDRMDRFVIWQAEAFTNAETINHTIDMLNEYKMYDNQFLSDFKSISNPLLRKLGLLPLISKILKPFTNGVAIQKANTYTYKTKHYSMSTAQNHYPGTFGDQQHIMNVCFGPEFNLFHTHPSVLPYSEENAYLSLSPNYWVGSGRLPHSVQDHSINLSIYNLPNKKAFMEKELLHYTHAYFPMKQFEEYHVEKNYAFMQYNGAFLAFIGSTAFEIGEDELILRGRNTAWVTELSSTDQESFPDFMKRISSNPIAFTKNKIEYRSGGTDYELKFKGDFLVDKKKQSLEYDRFDTPFVQAKRNASAYEIHCGQKKLILDLNNETRIEKSEK